MTDIAARLSISSFVFVVVFQLGVFQPAYTPAQLVPNMVVARLIPTGEPQGTLQIGW